MKYEDYFKQQTEQFLSFESTNNLWKEGQTRFLNKHFLNLDTNLNILDVACGDGVGLAWFKEKQFKNVFGVEFSPQKSEKAKQYGYSIYQNDMHSLPFQDKFFDIIYSSHTLEHSYSPSVALKEWSRVLKDDGLLVLVLPYPDTSNEIAHLGKFELRTTINDRPDAADLCDFLIKCNFHILSKEFDDKREPEVWLKIKKNTTNNSDFT